MEKLRKFFNDKQVSPINGKQTQEPFDINKAKSLQTYLELINGTSKGGKVTIRKVYKNFLTNVWNLLPHMSKFPNKADYQTTDGTQTNIIAQMVAESVHPFLFGGLTGGEHYFEPKSGAGLEFTFKIPFVRGITM